MSYRAKMSAMLMGCVGMVACGGSPAAPTLEAGAPSLSQVATPTRPGGASDTPRRGTVRDPERPDVNRHPDVDRRRPRPEHDRLAAAAREAIESALELLERVNELVGRDPRPAMQDALAEARQLISQATQAFNGGDYSRALVKAKNATDILEMILRVLG